MISFREEQATATNYFHFSFRVRLLCIALLFAPILVEADDKLRFVTLDFAPFIYGENQNVAGPGYEIILAVCKRAQIDCSFDIYPWRRAQELMRAGKADGMMVIGRNSKREQWIRFTPPHFRTEYGIFVQADNPLDVAEVTALAGLRVGVFSPSNTATQLISISERISNEGLEPIKIEKRPDDASGFRKLAVGRLDAVYSNRDRGRMIIEAEGLQNKIRYAGGHQGILYYAGFTREFSDTYLLDRFDKAWEAIFAEGEGQQIIRKFGLEPAP